MSRLSNEALGIKIESVKELMNEHFKNLNGTISDIKKDVDKNHEDICKTNKFKNKIIGALIVISTLLTVFGIQVFGLK